LPPPRVVGEWPPTIGSSTARARSQAALDETRHGPFDKWYDNDHVFGLKGIRVGLKKEIARLP